MNAHPAEKYRPFQPIQIADRTWPSAVITEAPFWCAVDLRDGNQALVDPMDPLRKRRLFHLLVEMGFKEIEVGFPAASQADYDFLRLLIDEGLIPGDVTIQVLTQCREDLIRRTFEAIKGAPRVVVHIYNSTSPAQRQYVFGMEPEGIMDLATKATALVKDLARAVADETRVTLQYSPESFSQTELPFARDICQAVMAVWEPTPADRIILNLPATVEAATPNVHADQIEWFCRNLDDRDCAIISVHPHNDRGTAVAAAELAVMAGAQRVEGTLFGNGERTGNVDLVTLGLNLYSQGVDPRVDFSDLDRVRAVAEECTRMSVPPRHPYAGELVFTAFSGSHQDAINKGLKAVRKSNRAEWDVPYLPIDPEDIGRTYEAVIRVNSQSGKGGVAHVMERDYGLELPRALQVDFAQRVQAVADDSARELTAPEMHTLFERTYMHPAAGAETAAPVELVTYHTLPDTAERDARLLTATVTVNGEKRTIEARGNGPIDAFVKALTAELDLPLDLVDYHEHAVGHGADAQAASYVEVRLPEAGRTLFGVAMHSNIVVASLNAVLAVVNRARG